MRLLYTSDVSLDKKILKILLIMDTLNAAHKKYSFMQALFEEMKSRGQKYFPRQNELAEGRVLTVSPQRMFVDLGPLGIGVVGWEEMNFLEGRGSRLSPGEAITVSLVDWEGPDGFLKLSIRAAGEEKRWQEIASLANRAEAISTKVISATRGGLVVKIAELEAFLPASQLADNHYPRVESGKPEDILRELTKLVGQTLTVRIFSWDRDHGKLIASERAVADEEIKQKLAKFSVGDVIKGKVKGIVDFGVFIGFDEDLEGLVHISELAWQLIDDPHEVVEVGQEVDAKIISIEGTRVSLSLRALKPNPWEKVGERYAVGQRVKGTVVKLHPFGAFVRLDPDIHGLIHISEFSGSEETLKAALELGKSYEFEITSLEPEARRLGLRLVPEQSL